ncbi:polysaccharide pyruvyl transferase family protein [Nocardioides jiangxiensis]|uniref:Polysaccharide pyruvyl transferase family protein n=1 Tax=Nocardioides jiangxiensis TaxID=3064524 RepID=A0ABT9B4H7_9ACTN|nr:polysaccharide pyruvyl transferase family protein [Nocardioides sp. WY-20]MDO7868502.1 polysaccharide pyruvyl transferase family protein [Nocardioides sp. WY-20]
MSNGGPRQFAGRVKRALKRRIDARRGTPAAPAAPAAPAPAPLTPFQRGEGKPILGLAGFFGPGNYGDELFLDIFHKYFPDFELRPLADLPSQPFFSRPVHEIVNEVDAILIGGGDILQPWARDPRYFNPKFLKKPCFVVGIGVPLYTGPNVKPPREETIASHRRFFHNPALKRVGVRDDQAANWIRENLEPDFPIHVAPDIVCTLDLPDAPKPEGAPILGIVTRFRPKLETPDDYSKVEELARHAADQGFRIRHIILGTGETGKRDVANAEDFRFEGKEVVYSEDLTDLTRAIGECTVLASMKFHGTVVATMYGVPSIVMIPTNKNRNFMNRIGLGDLVARFDSDELIEKFDNRPTPDPADLARIRQQAHEHMLELVASIKDELGVK